MRPSADPTSTKYPDRVFFSGRWRTPEQIETARAASRRYQKTDKGRESARQRTRREVASGAQAARKKRNRATAKAEGRCWNCLARSAEVDGTTCTTCRDKRNEGQRLRRHYGLPAPVIRALSLNLDSSKERVHADR